MDSIDQSAARRAEARFVPGRVGLVLSKAASRQIGRHQIVAQWKVKKLLKRLETKQEN